MQSHFALFGQGEVLLGDLSRSGFEITEEHEGTDAIIVNTCAFVDDAKAESLQVRGCGVFMSSHSMLSALHFQNRISLCPWNV